MTEILVKPFQNYEVIKSGRPVRIRTGRGLSTSLTGPPGSAAVVGTSTTSLAIGTGSKAFTIAETNRGWGDGARLRASSDADPANWMEGTVHTYSGTSLTLDVTHTNGSGSHNDWTINIAGEPGAGAVDSVNGQTGTVVLDAGDIGVREALTANRTYYVRTDGSNSNDGLADTSGGAFLTIQKAVDTAQALDNRGYTVTIQVGAGTYATGFSLAKPFIGGGTIILNGDTSTPDNCVIGSASIPFTLNNRVAMTIRGFKVISTGVNFYVRSLSSLVLSDIHFAATSGSGVAGDGNATFQLSGANFTISGAYSAFFSLGGGLQGNVFATQYTLSGTPSWSVGFAYAVSPSYLLASGSMSFTGSATGRRYSINGNALVNTGGGGASYFPGDVAGITATGGQYL